MVDRFERMSMVREPAGGSRVQPQHLSWISSAKLELEQVGKQTVATKPRPLRVDCRNKGVCVLELVQDALTSGAASQEVGERPVDPLEDRRP